MGLLADCSRKGAPARQLLGTEKIYTANFGKLLARWVEPITCRFAQQELSHVMADYQVGKMDFAEVRKAMEHVEKNMHMFSDDDHWSTDAICDVINYTYNMTFHGGRNPFPREGEPFRMPPCMMTIEVGGRTVCL